jgi:hypothetical protein
MEFQSPKFRNENVLQYELLLLLGLVVAGSLLLRRRVTEALWILFWAHQSLGSVRHITLFVAIAAPIIAVELTRFWREWIQEADRKSIARILDNVARDFSAGFGWTSVWPLAFLAGVFWWPTTVWPTDFPDIKFPIAIIEKHRAAIQSARTFTTDQWADYLIYRHYPNQKVFFDGRSDFYGPNLGKKYIQLLEANWNWRKHLDEFGFDLVLIPPGQPLGTLMKTARGWKLMEDDGKALLFKRVNGQATGGGRASSGLGPKKAEAALMKSSKPSEFLLGDAKNLKAQIRLHQDGSLQR